MKSKLPNESFSDVIHRSLKKGMVKRHRRFADH
ncbi:MAG: hypothetical protein QME50_00135 [Candidatus Bathyarchaeota archaeon]|nr:hypothetical protein [Candidatus Bathyarchaeota archaeon]